MAEYYEALRIPRQHYKFIEKLKYEELMRQKDDIVAKFCSKFGVDREKALSMMVMPDPKLPPEKMLEMVTGGKLAVDKPTEPAAVTETQTPVKIAHVEVPKSKKTSQEIAPAGLLDKAMQKEMSALSILSKATAATYQFESSASRASLSSLM